MDLRLSGRGMSNRRLRPRRGVVLTLIVALGLPAACGDTTPDTPSGEVVLYTSMPDAVVNRLAGVIEQRFPDLDGNYWISLGAGITVKVVRGRTGDMQRLIAQEIAQGALEADIIWLAEPSPYETYKDMGLLAPYDPPAESPIPSGYVDPDGFYVAGRVISMVIAWNVALRPEGLVDWPDLEGLERTAFPGPESGAARATISALLEEFGPDFFETLAGSGGVSVASNGAARDGLIGGELEAIAVLDYMARQAMSGRADIDFVYPASGTVIIPSPMAMMADAPNPAAAKVVLDFILSRAGQEIVVELGSFYPARTDVAPPDGAPPLDTIRALDVDWNALAVDTDTISTLWGELFDEQVTAP